MLQFSFKIAHNAGSANIATDFFSRLEFKITEKIRLKIREDIQTTPIEVATSSSDVAAEERFFSHKQTIRMSQKNESLNFKIKHDKMRSNG